MEGVAQQCGDGWTTIRIGFNSGGAGSAVKLGSEGSIFSIIKSATDPEDKVQSTIAANEKSLSDQRDLFSTPDGWTELFHIFGDKEIQAAGQYLEGGAIKRVTRDRGFSAVSLSNGSSKSVGSGGSKTVKKGKETTAAAFFGAKTTKKIEKKNTATSSKEVKGKENNKSSGDEVKSKPKSMGELKAEKQSSNVDDFVGDEDEDEEFQQQESERKARVAREARKQVRSAMNNENVKKWNTGSLAENRKSAPKSSSCEDDAMEVDEKKESDDEVEYDDCVKKPMDAFAKRAANSSEGAKKRRKKLVEKTIMENGYLKTITEEVWEEYEEEAQPNSTAKSVVKADVKPAPAAKKSKGPPKGKKQGSLMGFFSKK